MPSRLLEEVVVEEQMGGSGRRPQHLIDYDKQLEKQRQEQAKMTQQSENDDEDMSDEEHEWDDDRENRDNGRHRMTFKRCKCSLFCPCFNSILP